MNPKVTTKIRYLLHFNIVQAGNLMVSKIVKYNHLSIEAIYMQRLTNRILTWRYHLDDVRTATTSRYSGQTESTET